MLSRIGIGILVTLAMSGPAHAGDAGSESCDVYHFGIGQRIHELKVPSIGETDPLGPMPTDV